MCFHVVVARFLFGSFFLSLGHIGFRWTNCTVPLRPPPTLLPWSSRVRLNRSRAPGPAAQRRTLVTPTTVRRVQLLPSQAPPPSLVLL